MLSHEVRMIRRLKMINGRATRFSVGFHFPRPHLVEERGGEPYMAGFDSIQIHYRHHTAHDHGKLDEAD